MNFRTKRSSPERVVADLAHICRREKQERYGGRDDWRRLAYAPILAAGGDSGGALLQQQQQRQRQEDAPCDEGGMASVSEVRGACLCCVFDSVLFLFRDFDFVGF